MTSPTLLSVFLGLCCPSPVTSPVTSPESYVGLERDVAEVKGSLAIQGESAVTGREKAPTDIGDHEARTAQRVPKPRRYLDVRFVPTASQAVDKMLELAEIKRGDVLYDLGCGDGRIVIAAAKKYGIKAVGFDLDPLRVKESRANVRRAGVQHLVTIRRADIFTLDLSEASVVTLYLLPRLNVALMPQLRRLRPGSRIVSYMFDMKGAKPAKTLRDTFGTTRQREIYMWYVPWPEE